MKLSEILKQLGLFSNDIKLRLKNKQISVNGVSINTDIDLDVEEEIIKAGDFVFKLLKSHKEFEKQMEFLGFENLFDFDSEKTNVKNELTSFLNNFICIKISKKEIFILKKVTK
jgi:hypothetical protein